jgi:hypothetical protein
VKSPKRTHHSRVEVASAAVSQDEDAFTVTVTFTFHPWDRPSVYPVGYAADALTAVDSVIEAGFEALEQADRQAATEVIDWD